MGELTLPDRREKLPYGQMLLLSEPIFKFDNEWEDAPQVPLGSESWIRKVMEDSRPEEDVLRDEYAAIAIGLHNLGVDFSPIVADRKKVDGVAFSILAIGLGVRGLSLDPNILSLGFPRDMMTTFSGQEYTNQKANFSLVNVKGKPSPLGEGGRVLKVGGKVFVPTPKDFLGDDPRYAQHIRELTRRGFRFGFLPWPFTTIFDKQGTDILTSDHLDRAAAFLKGKEGEDYLLLDSNYANAEGELTGEYLPIIEEACRGLDVTPVVVNRDQDSIPYALNMEQFADGSVLMTGGDPELEEIVEDIVGEGKVQTTEIPIVYYPILRRGGIRCMTLPVSNKIRGAGLAQGVYPSADLGR